MEKKKVLRILALALTIALLFTALPTSPVLAVTLDAYPDEGEVGDEFELAGYDLATSYRYDVYFSDERASASGSDEIDEDVINYEYLGEITTESDGTTQYNYFDVPAKLTDGDDVIKVHGGTYYIYAVTPASDIIRARAEFTVEVTTEIALDTEEGAVGTEVEITGAGYDENEDIIVEYDGDDVDIEDGDSHADSIGEFTCTIIIPESTAGEHTITVTGDDSDLDAEADFTVEPEITVSPTSGAGGDTVTVTGTGFGDEVDVAVTFDNSQVDTDETDDEGNFEISFNVPNLEEGSYDIEAEDDDDNSAEAEFTIGATTAGLSASSGSVGDTITFSGSGFQAEKSITIAFGDDNVATDTTDDDGSFEVSFTVPSLTAGTYTVKASDGINKIETTFIISTGASISPNTGNVGTTITVRGEGFTPSGTVTITYDGTQMGTKAINADGSFEVSFNAPASSGGAHSVGAADGTNTKTLSFIMESNPPSTIYPQLPLMDSELEDWRFDWCGDATDLTKEVTDDSPPITYTLQIATGGNFTESEIVLEKPGLTQSEYTLLAEEKLESAGEESPYYWRVKAIDGASNEGSWTGTGSFYVSGFSMSMSQPLIYTLFGVGALVLGVIGFWLGRKTAYF